MICIDNSNANSGLLQWLFHYLSFVKSTVNRMLFNILGIFQYNKSVFSNHTAIITIGLEKTK